MGRVIEALVQFLESESWSYSTLNPPTALKIGFQGKNADFNCYLQERPDQEQLVIYSIVPVRTPDERMQQAVEFITRANFGLIIGNFEFDYQDGEIRFKTSIDVENVEITGPLLSHLIYANVLTADRYMPGLFRVLFAGVNPEAAIQEIEGE